MFTQLLFILVMSTKAAFDQSVCHAMHLHHTTHSSRRKFLFYKLKKMIGVVLPPHSKITKKSSRGPKAPNDFFLLAVLFEALLFCFLSPHFLPKERGSQELITCVLTNVLDAVRVFEWFSIQEKETHPSQHIVTLVHSSQTILTHSTWWMTSVLRRLTRLKRKTGM